MDRTVIDTWKAEEKEFGEKLHRKLTALTTMIYTPTDDFKKCFVQDMFLKPNQKAFFHVMHYLFTLLDPAEFKKRFYWPIADKKSEANFRSSTIQYLMHLNEKHNLQWNNIKSYLVVMPGGMKFILFLLDLTDFITKELIKHREKSIAAEGSSVQSSDFNIKRMKEQNKLHKEFASRYIKATDLQIVRLKDNVETLRKHINSISIPKHRMLKIMEDLVLSDFASSNRQLFEDDLKLKIVKVSSIEDSLKSLKETIDRFQNHEADVKVDKEMVKRSLLKIKSSYPDLEVGVLLYDTDSDVQIGSLLTAFNRIYPDVETNIAAFDQKSNRYDFIGNGLCILKSDIIQIETQLTKFLSSISEDSRNPQTRITPARPNPQSQCEGVFFSKFINTPPIKLDMVDNKMNNNPRLPFLDDFVVERSIESFCFSNQQNTLFPTMTVPRSARKHQDHSIRQPQSTTKSKIVDPLQLLRTLNKDTSKSRNISRNLSSLASKWKKHESLFASEEADSSQIEQSQTILTMTVNSPFGSNDKTTVARQELNISRTACALDTSIVYSRKISAVQKVQGASWNFQNLSTSPSGRLDPLVSFDPHEFPKILLNDRTLLETTANKSCFLKGIGAEKCNLNHGDLDRSLRCNKNVVISDENDGNASNLSFDFKNKIGKITSDAIFDISDGVLKDITM